MRHASRLRSALLAFALALCAAARARAANARSLADIYITADGPLKWLDEKRYSAEQNVLFDAGDFLLQADRVVYDTATGRVEAEGRVVLKNRGATLYARKLTYDSATGDGEAEGAELRAEPYYISGERVEKTGPERFVIHRGELTSCTQAHPMWTMKVTRATVTLHDYVRVANARVHAGPVPALWIPWLVYPIKDERTSGLLVPHVGYGERNGYFLSNTLYWAPAGWVESLTSLDLYSREGAGWGEEVAYKPSREARGQLDGYYIHEKHPLSPAEAASGFTRDRWSLDWFHRQPFGEGWLAFADVHAVSDRSFYAHYGREYQPAIRSFDRSDLRLSLERPAWGFRLDGERQKQFFLDAQLTQFALPAFNLHLNEVRLAPTITASAEGELDRIRKQVANAGGTAPLVPDYEYGRSFFSPRLTWAPFSWPALKGKLVATGTHAEYSKTVDPLSPLTPVDASLSRNYYRGRFELAGPVFYRLYGDEKGVRWRHSFGVDADYTAASVVSGSERVPIYDERDLVASGERLVTLDFHSRLSRKADPQAIPEERLGADLTFRYSAAQPFPAPPGATPTRMGPAGLEVRWRAGAQVAFDGRYYYDFATHRADSLSVSAHLEEPAHSGYLDLHYFRVNQVNLSQFQLAQGISGQTLTQSAAADQLQVFMRRDFLADHVGLGFATTYDFNRRVDTGRFFQLRLRGQCATLITEAAFTRDALNRVIPTYRFSIDFLGLGTLVNTTAAWPKY